MAYTLEQWQQLPELQGMSSLDQLSGFQDQLNNYSFYDPTKIGTNPLGNALQQNSYDFGGQRAISNTTLDYYKNLASSANAAGLGQYNIQNFGPQLTDLYNFEPARFDIPVARFGTTAGAQDMRYIPYEFATKLQYDPNTDQLRGIQEFLGNQDIFNNAQLVRLPELYANQVASRDWAGTNYNLTDPTLGFMMTADQLGQLYGSIGASAQQGYARPDLIAATSNAQPYYYEGNYTMPTNTQLGAGAASGFANQMLRQMTPEARDALLAKLNEFSYTGNELERLYQPYQDNYGGTSWIRTRPDVSAYTNLINNAEWWAPSATDTGSYFLYDTSNPYAPSMNINPYNLTSEGAQQVQSDFQALQGGSNWLDDVMLTLGPLFIGAMAGGMFEPGGFLGGAAESTLPSMGLDDLAVSSISGAADTGSVLGGFGDALGSAFDAAGNYLTDPATLEKLALNAGQQVLTTGEIDPEKLLTNAAAGTISAGLNDLTGGLTDIPLLDKAIATAGTGMILGQDPSTAITNAGIGTVGNLAGGYVAGQDIGGAGSLIDTYLPGAISLGTQTALKGGDIESALTNYFMSAGISDPAKLLSAVQTTMSQLPSQDATGSWDALGGGSGLDDISTDLTTGGGQTNIDTTFDAGADADLPFTTDYSYDTQDAGADGTFNNVIPDIDPTTMTGAPTAGENTMDEDFSYDYDPSQFDYDALFGADPYGEGTPGTNDTGTVDFGGIADYLGGDQYGEGTYGADVYYDDPNYDSGAGTQDPWTTGSAFDNFLNRLASRLFGTGAASAGTTAARGALASLFGLSDNTVGGILGLLAGLGGLQANRSSAFRQGLSAPSWGGAAAGRGRSLADISTTPTAIPQTPVNPIWNQPLQRSKWSEPFPTRKAHGGLVQYAGGGMLGTNNNYGPTGYVRGGSAGQDDKIPALLSDGEFVIPADVVSHLGDGNNEAGAKQLYDLMSNVRKHKKSPKSLPPKARPAAEYLK